jgi:subtilase family serine protease
VENSLNKYRISRRIRRTFFPEKCDFNSNLFISKVINTRTSIGDAVSENDCEDDFSGSDDDFLVFYDE